MTQRNRLPNRRASSAFSFEFEGQNYRASVSRFADGTLAEIFLDAHAKIGSAAQTDAQSAALRASLCLQHGVPAYRIRAAVHGPIALALAIADGVT